MQTFLGVCYPKIKTTKSEYVAQTIRLDVNDAYRNPPFGTFLSSKCHCIDAWVISTTQQRWKMQFYYPNFHNDMWRIFGLVFFNDKEHFLDVANKSFYEQKLRQFLTQTGIAISDSTYQIKRGQNNASDKHLHIVTPADLTALLTKLPNCHTIMTTGELAATTTLSLLAPNAKAPKLGGHTTFDFLDKSMALYRLPSSSRAYPLALDKKASQYQTFFKNIGLL